MVSTLGIKFNCSNEIVVNLFKFNRIKYNQIHQFIDNSLSLDFNNKENILHHALAAEYFGMKYIYLENGSGSDSSIKPGLVNYLYKNINIPIIVGGGIKTRKEIQDIKEAGARFIVIGNLLEENPDSNFFSSLLD